MRGPIRLITAAGVIVIVVALVVVSVVVFRSQSPSTSASQAPNAGTPRYWQGKPPVTQVRLPALPAPLTASGASADEIAGSLAATVEAGGDDALPALLTALRESGYSVRSMDGSVAVSAAAPSDDLIFQAWETQALVRGRQLRVAFTDLAGSIAKLVPEFAGAPLAATMLADIRNGATAATPTTRFWARFVAELGNNGARPNDLLASAPSAAIELDGIQSELILHRFASDLARYSRTISRKGDAGSPRFASLLGGGGTLAIFGPITSAMRQAAPGPCAVSETGERWAAGGASGAAGVFETTMHFLESAGIHGVEGAGKVLTGANMLINYAKLIYLYMNLNGTIEMDKGGPPLVRTKNRTPGEPHQLSMTLRMDLGDGERINCFRQVLAAMGIDLSVPNDGVVPNAPISWKLVQGAGPNGWVEFFGKDPEHQTTDESGKAQIGIEGQAQKREFPDNASPRMRKARVQVVAAIKGNDLVRDLFEAGGAGVGGISSVLTLPVEELMRSKWFVAADYPFQVKDWGLPRFRLELDTTIRGDFTPSRRTYTAHARINGMILGDADLYTNPGHTGENGAPSVAMGAAPLEYGIDDYTIDEVCLRYPDGFVAHTQAVSVTSDPDGTEAAIWFDVDQDGSVKNPRLYLSLGIPRENLHCVGHDLVPPRNYSSADFSGGWSLLHFSGDCPGVSGAGNAQAVCWFTTETPGVWKRMFSGPGNKADVPSSLPVPLGELSGVVETSEQTTITITQLPD